MTLPVIPDVLIIDKVSPGPFRRSIAERAKSGDKNKLEVKND